MSKNTVNRREFMKIMGTMVGATALAGCASGQQSGDTGTGEAFYTGTVIRTLSNEYHAAWNRGGRIFAESIGQGQYNRPLLCEGDSEKQLTLMQALISEGGENVVFNIDPNQSPDAKPIADMCAEAKVYFMTQWNKPDDLHPWDYDPYWVAHMGVDGVPSGYYVATELFKAMGGEGQIVALQGLLANVPAIQRFDGLKQALDENPGIELRGRLNRRGNTVIEVEDNGHGVPEEIATKIFVPFFTTREGGSGVGLALARQVMIAHGGFIRLGRKQGAGTTFTLTF